MGLFIVDKTPEQGHERGWRTGDHSEILPHEPRKPPGQQKHKEAPRRHQRDGKHCAEQLQQQTARWLHKIDDESLDRFHADIFGRPLTRGKAACPRLVHAARIQNVRSTACCGIIALALPRLRLPASDPTHPFKGHPPLSLIHAVPPIPPGLLSPIPSTRARSPLT